MAGPRPLWVDVRQKSSTETPSEKKSSTVARRKKQDAGRAPGRARFFYDIVSWVDKLSTRESGEKFPQSGEKFPHFLLVDNPVDNYVCNESLNITNIIIIVTVTFSDRI